MTKFYMTSYGITRGVKLISSILFFPIISELPNHWSPIFCRIHIREVCCKLGCVAAWLHQHLSWIWMGFHGPSNVHFRKQKFSEPRFKDQILCLNIWGPFNKQYLRSRHRYVISVLIFDAPKYQNKHNRYQRLLWVWAQQMREGITLWRSLSLAEPIPKMGIVGWATMKLCQTQPFGWCHSRNLK